MAPELATGKNPVSSQAWFEILTWVNQGDMTGATVGESVETDRLAKMYLAAHFGKMLTLSNTAAVGPLTGETVGGVRRSFGLLPFAGWLSSLSTTRYGQSYITILSMSLAHGPIVI